MNIPTAEEARNSLPSNVRAQVAEIENKLRVALNNGDREIWIYDWLHTSNQGKLRDLGYKIQESEETNDDAACWRIYW